MRRRDGGCSGNSASSATAPKGAAMAFSAVAARLSVRPPDWTRDNWRRVDPADPARSLARIIKFGLPGSPMAGHETLEDAEVVALAVQVRDLHNTRTTP